MPSRQPNRDARDARETRDAEASVAGVFAGAPRRRPDRARLLGLALLPALFGALAAALCFVATEPGPGLTPDSIQYLSAAQNLAAGNGAVTSVTPLEVSPPRVPFAAWPPVFPLLLSYGVETPPEGSGTPLAPLRWARTLDLLALAFSFFPLALLAWWLVGRRGAALVLAFASVFRPLHLTASFVWSETIFTLFVLIALAALVRALDLVRLDRRRATDEEREAIEAASPGDPVPALPPSRWSRETAISWFFAAGLLAGLAASTRYLGLAVLAAGGLAIIVRAETESGRRVIARLAAFLIPAALPPMAWAVRNRLLTGYFFGEARGESTLTAEEVFHQALRTLGGDWMAPPAFAGGGLATGATVAGAAAFLWIAAHALRRYGPATLESRTSRMNAATVGLAFVIIYVGLIVATALRVPYDPVSSRLLTPVYPVLLVLAAALVRGAWEHPETGRRTRASLLAAIGVLLALNAAATVRYARAPREDRELSYPYWRTVTWGDPSWREQEAFAWIRGLPADAVVLSNVWEAVALHTGRPAKPLPPKWDRGYPASVLRYSGAWVLVAHDRRPDVVDAADLKRIGAIPPGIVPVRTTAGATLLRVRSALGE